MLLPTEEIDADQALLSVGATLISLLETPATVAHLREGRVPRQAGSPPAAAHRRRRTIWAMSSRLQPRARASAV